MPDGNVMRTGIERAEGRDVTKGKLYQTSGRRLSGCAYNDNFKLLLLQAESLCSAQSQLSLIPSQGSHREGVLKSD